MSHDHIKYPPGTPEWREQQAQEERRHTKAIPHVGPAESGAGASRMIKGPATQPWVHNISFMQQSVLFGVVRGPDGIPKYHPVKPIIRWYRRCLLVSALDGEVITNPTDRRGGSFTGPSFDYHGDHSAVAWEKSMDNLMDQFIQTTDAMPVHFMTHLLHAIEIMGYKHGDQRIRSWWLAQYVRLVEAWHLYPESEAQMDARLGDNREGWLARSDKAITK